MRRELFQSGDRIGDYEIISKLRAGGMATLFLGRRHGAAGVSRPVVVKVIHPHLAEDDLIVRMFIDEARISSHISHANVVYVERFGEFEGIYYIVMEFVDGCSCDQLLRTVTRRNQRLAPEVAVHIAIETAAGLHAAHETVGDDGAPLGIVHRDVSPSNILLTHDGSVKVIDFGIAKARNRLGITADGSGLKGKLRYMSPEQAWGRDLDRRADVYALGVVLWEMLTCTRLFKAADDLAVLELVRNPSIPPPSSVNPAVSAALDAVVQRATAPEAGDRLPTAQEFRRQLIHAMPPAVSIPEDMIPNLVIQVRETLGPQIAPAAPEDDKATTPATPAHTESEDPQETTPYSARHSDTSMQAAASEVSPPLRSRRRGWIVALGGLVTVGAVGVLIASQLAGGAPSTPRGAAATPAPPAADAAALGQAPADAAAVVELGVVDAAVITAPVDAAVVVVPSRATKSRNRFRSKPEPTTTTGVEAVNVDGSMLADDTTKAKPKPKPKPKPKARNVEIDGTVLAE